MREIRTLRAMWRALETELRSLLNGHEEGNLGHTPSRDLRATADRDRGKLRSSSPPTPPDMRVRIRRFGGLSDRFHSQSRNPERVEVSIGQCDAERGRIRQPPRTMSAARRLSGQVGVHIPSA